MRYGLCLLVMIAACGSPAVDAPVDDPAPAGATHGDSAGWFSHEEDNSRFIERYEALHDSSGAPKDTTVIYTDTWSGPGKYQFVGSDSIAPIAPQ